MPSFEIPDGPTSIPLKSDGGFLKGSAVFGVTNKTAEGLTARLSVQVQGAGKTEWYQVQGESERAVAAGETQTVTVVAKIPGATPAGQHVINLRALNVNDPDNDSTDSAAVAVVVPAKGAPPPPPKRPFPWWIVAVVGGVLVVVIAVIIAIVMMSGGSKVPDVVGQTYADAAKTLDKAGYKTLTRTDEQSGEAPDKVLRQTPLAGAKAAKDKIVALTVAIPKPVVIVNEKPPEPEKPAEPPPVVEPPKPPPVPPEPGCNPSIGTCIDGFVYRQAGYNDLVCVPPESREQAAAENAQAGARRNPAGGPYGYDTCLQGYVWRDGFVNDHVCVTVERRTNVAAENRAGPGRHRDCRPGSP